MNLTREQHARPQGSVLIVSLLVCLAGTIGMAALVSLINNRGYATELTELGVKRRLSNLNSRILAKDYLYQGPIISGATTATTLSLANEWASVSIPDFTAPISSNQEFAVINRLSPSSEGGFTRDVVATISHVNSADGAITRPIQLRMISRSPLLSGALLNVQKSVLSPSSYPAISGSVVVEGRTVTHGAVTGIGTANSPLTTNFLEGPDGMTGGTQVSNYPKIRRSSGIVSGAPGTVGEFNFIYNTATSNNTLYGKMIDTAASVTVDGNTVMNIAGVVCCDDAAAGATGPGIVTINLNSHILSPIILGNHVSKVKLIGQASPTELANADLLQPAFILAMQDATASRELVEFVMQGQNKRRLVLGVRKTNPTAAVVFNFNQTGSSLSWRGMFYAENTSVTFSAPQAEEIILVGGLHLDRALTVASGDSLRIRRETSPDGLLERLGPREVWVETYLQ